MSFEILYFFIVTILFLSGFERDKELLEQHRKDQETAKRVQELEDYKKHLAHTESKLESAEMLQYYYQGLVDTTAASINSTKTVLGKPETMHTGSYLPEEYIFARYEQLLTAHKASLPIPDFKIAEEKMKVLKVALRGHQCPHLGRTEHHLVLRDSQNQVAYAITEGDIPLGLSHKGYGREVLHQALDNIISTYVNNSKRGWHDTW